MEHETQIKTAENGVKKTPELSEKQTAYLLLRKQGMPVQSAAKATGYNPNYAYQLEKKIKSYDLTDEFWLSEATKALKNILKGKTFGEIEKIKDSTALGAAQMIYDSHQPVVKHSKNLNLNVDIDFVDLEKYRT